MHVAARHPERRLEDFGARDRLGRVIGGDEVGKDRDQHKRDQDRQRQHRQLPCQTGPAPRDTCKFLRDDRGPRSIIFSVASKSDGYDPLSLLNSVQTSENSCSYTSLREALSRPQTMSPPRIIRAGARNNTPLRHSRAM